MLNIKEGYENTISGETELVDYSFDYEKETNDYNNNINNLPDNSNSTIPYDYQGFKENVNEIIYQNTYDSESSQDISSNTYAGSSSNTYTGSSSNTTSGLSNSKNNTNKYNVKYINVLINDLVDTDTLSKSDVDVIRNKLQTKIVTTEEMVVSLEKLLNGQYNTSKNKNTFEYIIKNISIQNINEKYINALSNKLLNIGSLTMNESSNLKNKVLSGVLTEEEVILSLEKLHLKSMEKNDMQKYSIHNDMSNLVTTPTMTLKTNILLVDEAFINQ